MNNEKRILIARKRKLRAGFSLGELLAVVAILGILMAFGGVSAVNMYRNMKQTQLDKTAETIFHAAQDRLSELYAYGKEGVIDKAHGGRDVIGYEDKKVFYIKSGDSTEASMAIMGDDTVNGDVFTNYWVIEYQASTCRVINVLYADKNKSGLGGFGGGINEETTLMTLETALLNKQFSLNDRKNKYGWYGDASLTDLQDSDKQVGNTSVDVEIINEENLYAHVKVSVGWEDDLATASEVSQFLENVKVTLTLKDAESETSKVLTPPNFTADMLMSKGTIDSESYGFYNGKSDNDPDSDVDYIENKYLNASWDILLDSLSAGAFTGSNKVKTFDGFASGITPGNNFYLIARLECVDTSGVVPTVQDYDIENSLFAGVSGNKAFIEYGRHLQNIGKTEVAGLNAIQIADIDFDAEAPSTVKRESDLDKFNKFWRSVYKDVDGFTDYEPGDSAYLASYDGQNHVIKNLDINKVTGSSSAGILGNLSYTGSEIAIKNVIITDSTISNTSGASKAGMFAASVTGSGGVSIENCYLNNVTVDGSGTASIGGFIGEITSTTKVKNCAFANVKAGTNESPAASGAFAGTITGSLEGENLFAFGGQIRGTLNAGGLIGSTDSASESVALKGCKVSGTEVNASTGNAGGIVGNTRNSEFTISEDSAAAGCIVKSSSGNAGGLIGNADSAVTIKDSEYYLPVKSEGSLEFSGNPVAGTVSKEFARTMGLTVDTPEALISYDNLESKVAFKYVQDLKTSDISGMKWITGYGNAGGLVGASTKDVNVENSFAAGVLSAATNAGGLVGSTDGKLSVKASYTDFYISGKNVGGFAANCGASSAFESCYTAGFLTDTATSAAGFAPVAVGNISNSYTIFNFDNVCGFGGKAGQDSDHNLNVNGTVNNYPDVNVHNGYYPIAASNSGTAYYVYTATDFIETSNAVAVTANELAANKKDGGAALLSGEFDNRQGTQNTEPYLLSSFFNDVLADYPFPTLEVNKATVTETKNTVLKHYNDWLIFDGKNDIEIWYIMYDENLNNLKTDVPSIGSAGMKFARKTKAIPTTTASGTEYQINVGAHTSFSGYKFVGYYDPDTAKVGTSSFDRARKLDYLAQTDEALLESVKNTMKTGDRVVQTSINGTNTFGEDCNSHKSILQESSNGSKRLYAVYRFNKPYTVTLSYREYKLPTNTATSENKTLEEIYTKSKKLAADDLFETTYKEAKSAYRYIYKYRTDLLQKVGASHNKLAHDEEYIEDYIAEDWLSNEYGVNSAQYKEIVEELEKERGKDNKLDKTVRDFTSDGFVLLNFKKLNEDGIITDAYYNNEKDRIHNVARITPANGSGDFADRVKKVECTNNKYSMLTDKTGLTYVVLYNANLSNMTLNLVFGNTVPNAGSSIPVEGDYDNLCETLEKQGYNSESSNEYKVQVAKSGLQGIGSLVELMDPKKYPSFSGFTFNRADSHTAGDGSKTVTLYYDRNKYTIYFKLANSTEHYHSSGSRNEVQLFYGQPFQDCLWEIENTSDITVSITGNTSGLNSSTNIQIGTSDAKGWHVQSEFSNYQNFENHVRQLSGNTGSFTLRFKNSQGNYTEGNYQWNKTTGNFEYAFNRSGHFLTGFEYYYQNDSGTNSYAGKNFDEKANTTNTIENVLFMPNRDVLIVPVWKIAPTKLRVELYYQSANDDIGATGEAIDYEFYKATVCDVTDGKATKMTDEKGQIKNLHKELLVSNLDVSGNTDSNFVSYLAPFVENDFIKRVDHDIKGGLNPYIIDESNSLKFGKPHYDSNNTMIVALYYDRKPVEYRFHYTNTEFHVDRYYYNDNYYTLRNQWADFIANSSLAKTGLSGEKATLSSELRNPSGQWKKISTHAMVRVNRENPSIDPVANTSIRYGFLHWDTWWGQRYNYTYTTGSVSGIKYGMTITYKALYGAPAVFSDGTSLIPEWYYTKNESSWDSSIAYKLGGSNFISSEFSLGSFSIYDEDGTNSLDKDMYPYYPVSTSGAFRFYTELSPGDTIPSGRHIRTSASDAVPSDLSTFSNNAIINSPKESNNNLIIKYDNGAIRTFIDGYTTYGYKLDNGSIKTGNAMKNEDGSDATNMYIYLQRNTYTLGFVDATLKNGSTFVTSYLYKQEIPSFPGKDDIECPYGSNYNFEGWYTSSSYTTKIADDSGKIENDYLNSSSALTYTDAQNKKHLLMNSESIQVFAHWVPNECNITFNPYYPYPDPASCDEDSRLGKIAVKYGRSLKEEEDADPEHKELNLPEVQAPLGDEYTNVTLEKGSDGKIYYNVKKDSGEIVRQYEFLGWYKYAGGGKPTNMNDLKDEFDHDETKVTSDIVLYAKWKPLFEEATYTITCLDYSNGGKEIFKVERSGKNGDTITIKPPASGDSTDNDLRVFEPYKYSDLDGYEPLSDEVETTLVDGMTITFRYFKISEWWYTVKNCITIDGQDIVMNSITDHTTLALKLIAISDLPGYSAYQYQIGEYVQEITDVSDYINVDRPDILDNKDDPLVITVRYHYNEGTLVAKDTVNYYKYDPINWVECALSLEEGSNWENAVFGWEDEDYAPAIIYTVNDVTTSAFIGNSESNAEAAKVISDITPNTYTASMKLVAMKKSDTSLYLPISDIVTADTASGTLVTIKKSAHALTFTGDNDSDTGVIYYKFAGENSGNWYWDEACKYQIGADGTSIVADISESDLPGEVNANAQKVIKIVTDTLQESGKYKSFFVITSIDAQHITVVDEDGNIQNGNLLKGDTRAFKEGTSGTYTISIYDSDGNFIKDIEVTY